MSNWSVSVLLFRFIIALSISLGLFALELISFMAGVSMFTASQSLLCILYYLLFWMCINTNTIVATGFRMRNSDLSWTQPSYWSSLWCCHNFNILHVRELVVRCLLVRVWLLLCVSRSHWNWSRDWQAWHQKSTLTIISVVWVFTCDIFVCKFILLSVMRFTVVVGEGGCLSIRF